MKRFGSLTRSMAHDRSSSPRRSALTACLCVALLVAWAAPAQTQFEERAPKRYFPAVPDTTGDVRIADLDGDGDCDALTANGFQVSRLYLNGGEGIFLDATATHLPAPSPGSFLLRRSGIGDIEGDGDLDALFTSGRSASGPPLLLVNDGTGHFDDQTAARLPTGSLRDAARPLFGDVDGDSDLDLVAPRQGTQVNLFLNDGAGFFSDVSASQMPTSWNSNKEAALADVDGDLDLDLVLANQGQDRLYLNDGLGFFTEVTATHVPVETGFNSPKSMALADVDLDLDLDVVIGDGAASGQDVLRLNDGLGFFTDASFLLPPSADQANSIASGDVDGDLDPDIVLGNEQRSSLYLGDGTGLFVEASFPAIGTEMDEAEGLALADFDADGDLDLLMGRDGTSLPDASGRTDRLYLNDGAGGFTDAAPERIQWSLGLVAAAELVDLDGDGDQDLLAADGLLLQGLGYGEVRAHFNDGSGLFPTKRLIPTGNTVAMAVGDVDGDADPDLLAGAVSLAFLGYCCFATSNELWLNDGLGSFSQVPGQLPLDSDETYAVALADVDRDADLDAVFGNWQQQNRLYRNSGHGSFTDVTAGRLPVRADRTRALALGDFDGDDDLDIVVGNEGQQSRMYVNEGLGAFFDGTATRMPVLVRKTRALGIADLDLDGDLDLVLGNDGQAGLYLNNGTGKLLDFTDRMPQQSEETWALRLGDVDEDGDQDVVLGNQGAAGGPAVNRLLLNDGSASFVDSGRLPADPDPTAALALGDLDGDRDSDLVVGNLVAGSASKHDTNRVYLNLHRQLGARLLPLLGRTYEIELHSQPGYGTAPRPAIVLFSDALLPAPIAVPPVVGELHLVPSFFAFTSATIPSPAGSVVIELAVPSEPALVATTFYAQALILGPPAHLTGYLQDTFGL